MNRFSFLNFPLLLILFLTLQVKADSRHMEYLDRGLVAVKVTDGVFLSWRYLGTDQPETGFNLYRNDELITNSPIATKTNYVDAGGTANSIYKVVPVINNVEDTSDVKSIATLEQPYISIQLNRPVGGITEPNQYGSVGKTASGTFPNGQPYGYSPNDCSVGDLDGDGEYEIVVKWDPSNSQDNSYYGITGEVFLDAYKLDGTQLWRISLGKNIRAGAHYTQFLVYDFDGDGLAEVICKTAPGTIDGEGNYVIMNNDDPTADYRNLTYSATSGSNMLGTVLTGPEYLTLFDGRTGAELNSIKYEPERGTASSKIWGDTYGNRSERYLACVAYLDGVHPNAIMCRGYYARTTLAAYSVENKTLVKQWLYDTGSSKPSNATTSAYGQGNHNLSVANVDADGKDEIVYGSCAFDDDGSLLYSTGLGHGDAMHVSDLDPDIDGLEVFEVHEESGSFSKGYEMHSAATGEIIWSGVVTADNGRGLAADIDARYRGFEMWSTKGTGTYSCKGEQISSSRPSVNFRIYWDGDLQDELLDGNSISKWTGSGTTALFTASGLSSCNSTKKTPNLSADILGDWREELILWQTSDSSTIRIYTTTTPTDYRLLTLMHDPVYRLGIAWQNAAYNQPPHLGFYIGDGLDKVSQPDITTIKYGGSDVSAPHFAANTAKIYSANGELVVQSTETIDVVEVYSLTGRLIYRDSHIGQNTYTGTLPESGNLYIVRIKTKSGTQTGKVLK